MKKHRYEYGDYTVFKPMRETATAVICTTQIQSQFCVVHLIVLFYDTRGLEFAVRVSDLLGNVASSVFKQLIKNEFLPPRDLAHVVKHKIMHRMLKIIPNGPQSGELRRMQDSSINLVPMYLFTL